MLAFLLEHKLWIAWTVLMVIFYQFKEGIQSVIAATLTLFGLIILADFFTNLEGGYERKEFHIDPDIGMIAIGALTFLVTWIGCAAAYGFLFGFGLGWIPAYILAQILMLMWRVVSLAVISLLVLFTVWVH
ncbi:MAG: hypothetical protein H8K03_14445 [Nitrospira sp.]